MTQRLTILFVILLILTISACTTIEKTEIITYRFVLPPIPKRKEIMLPEEPRLKDYAEIINYYEHLVQEWEAWGKSVEKILDTK